jgi:hypothetical protein
MATNNRPLKAYVRFDGSGRVVAGSLILRKQKPKVGKWQEITAYECCNFTTTTTTTTFIPPGAIPISILIGYQTISPVEDIVVSFTLEDACILANNLETSNINFTTLIFDETTYYFDFDTLMLYNSVTNTFAEDGYYIVEGGLLQVIDGLSEILTLEDLGGLCNFTTTTTTTPTP